jgi:hypothetical protein
MMYYSEKSTDFQRSIWHCVPEDTTLHTTVVGTSKYCVKITLFFRTKKRMAHAHCDLAPDATLS